MKVLLLTQVLPYPPDSGPKVKTWNVLKYLASRHQVTLVSFVRGDQRADVAQLQSLCRRIYTIEMKRSISRDALAMARSLAGGDPWLMVRDDVPEMSALLDHLFKHESFDIIHADQMNMFQYARRAAEQSGLVLDAHNALWVLYRRLAATQRGTMRLVYARDWRLLKEYEGRVCRQAHGVLAVSPQDAAALQEAAGQSLSNLACVPIAIDTREVASVQRDPGADHILHIGTMFWAPNVDGILWFAREILPIIRARRPEVAFDVVGARPPKAVTDLNGAGIHVTGFVEDPLPYLRQAGVMIVPLRAGGGMRVKILNALAQGLPIVSTTIGAEGIEVKDGEHILIADTPQDFAAAVLRLLDDPALAGRLGSAGRALAETCYDFRAACQPIDDLYARAAAQAQEGQ